MKYKIIEEVLNNRFSYEICEKIWSYLLPPKIKYDFNDIIYISPLDIRKVSRNYHLTIKDIFVSMLSEKSSYALYFLKKNKVTRQNVIEQLTKERYGEDVGLQERQQGGGEGGGVRFEDYCTDLNKEAKEGRIDSLIGREPELDDIVHILARRKKNNCIVVGEPGVGKTAIAEGIAKKIVDKQVPDAIKDKTVYSLDVATNEATSNE